MTYTSKKKVYDITKITEVLTKIEANKFLKAKEKIDYQALIG